MLDPISLPFSWITTAIVYPNAEMHLGFAWECIAADWKTRAMRSLQGVSVVLGTGIDEHSLNVEKAARSKGQEPAVYCDQMAQGIRRTLERLGIQFQRLLRTSDPDHQKVVQQLLQRAWDQGDLYLAPYEGLYCESCEAYYTEKDLSPEGHCPFHAKKPRSYSENNYFFRLSKYEKPILEWLQSEPSPLQPEHRRSEILNFIQSGLKDFSISRASSRWGIPLPFDPTQVTYVWFDALANYLTLAGLSQTEAGAWTFQSAWPPLVHLIGKDITRFHTVYWPALLLSAGLPLPTQIFAHGHLLNRGQRMSKSLGTGVSPDPLLDRLGSPDPLRYFLLSESALAQDGNYDWEALCHRSNADLSNDWGNLLNRTIHMVQKYFPGETLQACVPLTHSAELKDCFEKLPLELDAALEAWDSPAYLEACKRRSKALNLYLDRMKPWILAKDPSEGARRSLRETLFTVLEGLRWLIPALAPVLVEGMPRAFLQLGASQTFEEAQGETQRRGEALLARWGGVSFCPQAAPEPLYRRMESQWDQASQ